MVLLAYWVFLIAVWSASELSAHPLLESCVKSGLVSIKQQSQVRGFELRIDVVSMVSEYERVFGGLSEGYTPFMEEYLTEIAMFLFHRNEIVIDYFWDSMMESLPVTWHVYGTRPFQSSIIRTRFMESCACNIYSLHREGKIEKFHTMVSNLRDTRYLTIGKVNEICRKIKDTIEDKGFDLVSGFQINGRSNVLAYYRCPEVYNDELADVLIFVLGKRVPSVSVSKFRICRIVEAFQRSPVSFRGSCIKTLEFELKEYLRFEKDSYAHLEFVCDIMENVRNFTGLFSQEPVVLSRRGIKDVIVDSLKRLYPNIELTKMGQEMVELMKISESRFIESCMNFSETLISLKGFKRTQNSSRKNHGDLSDFAGGWGDNYSKEEDKMFAILGDPRDIRKKLLLTCSGIHMYLMDLKPKGVSFTKLRNSRTTTPKDFEVVSKSKLLLFDSCKNEYVLSLGGLAISQDTLAEMFLSAILHASSKSTSSSSLYNGISKFPICKISGDIIHSMGSHISTSPMFDESSFITSCRQVIIENTSAKFGPDYLNSTIKKSTIKLCNVVAKSLVLISGMQKYTIDHQEDQEPTSSECISE
ncbi:putative signal peptide-containing protein [Cryptosporidium canis]|uniref:Signal peptide-containing protein n=1 Tax=Cryptosporidium canis TaxID=195482 RepID=A0A9D5I019_9CRYT|nr:putative signal peptide-containing protein [Cryptosporidium canis]